MASHRLPPADDPTEADDDEESVASEEPEIHPDNQGILPPLRPFEAPLQHYHYNLATRRVLGVVRREDDSSSSTLLGGSRNQRIGFYLQGIDGLFPTRPLFVAQRVSKGKFYIFDVSNHGTSGLRYQDFQKYGTSRECYVGKTNRKVLLRYGFTCSTLVQGSQANKRQVAMTIHGSDTSKAKIVDGSSDRLVYSVMCTPGKDNKNVSISKNQRPLDSIVKSHLAQDLSDFNLKYERVKVFQSKRRFSKNDGSKMLDSERFFPRFGYRGRMSSKKNVQIIDIYSGSILLQMARWNKDAFTVDFSWPYNAFQAFGFALAQLEA